MPDSIPLGTLIGALGEHALVSIADADGRIVHASASLLALGVERSDGATLHAHADEQVRGELLAGRAWQGLYQCRDRHGRPLWLQVTLLPLLGEAGRLHRSVMIATDVTRHERLRRAYEALVNPGTDVGVFPGIGRIVAEGLDCRGAGVARLSEDGRHVTTLGYWLDGAQHPVFTYALDGSPCAQCLTGSAPVVIESDVAAHFPRDAKLREMGLSSFRAAALHGHDGRAIGLLFAFDDQPCRDDSDDRAFLQVVARRAADELMRMLAEERLRISETSMRFALEAAELGLHEWDLETGASRCNERWADIRGYAPGEIVPELANSVARVHPDDAPRVGPCIERLRRGEIDSFNMELRTRTKRGDWRWIDARATTLEHYADGRPRRILGIQRDIHERRLAEQHLREQRQRLQLVLDASELGVWDWNPVTDDIVYDEQCAKMLGYTRDALPTKAARWRKFCHPDDTRQAQNQLAAQLANQASSQLRIEVRCRARDGRWAWLLSHGRVIERDAAGRAVRAVGIHQDISQRKYAEAALRESEARLRTVVESSPIGIFLTDPAGAIVYQNFGHAGLRGELSTDDYGFGWERRIHPDDAARVRQAWRRYTTNPNGLYDIEWRAVSREGRERLLRVRATVIRERERVIGFAGTAEDITETRAAELRERQLQLQLQQAQKMDAIGQLTGGIAHDFNNSLATILGFAALARRRCTADDAKMGQYMDAILQAGEHARELVEKMLAFSRNTPSENLQATRVQPLIAEAKRMLQSVIPTTMQIDTLVEEDVPAAQIDATGVNQLVVNLVLNARDAIGEHGHIRVCLTGPRQIHGECTSCRSSLDSAFIELSVADDGCGIPADHLHRIFDPFFSTKEVGKGTGMGLSVLHGILHRAGGHVIVESTPGSGTLIRLLLQVGREQGAISPPARIPAVSHRPRTGAHVLIVDDNPSVANYLRELLESHGYRTTVFNDPGEALSWLERGDDAPDIIVSDQTMPGLTGLDLLTAVRPRYPDLPVFLCTGLTDRASAERVRQAGIRRVFTKPIQTDEFLDELTACAPRAGATAEI